MAKSKYQLSKEYFNIINYEEKIKNMLEKLFTENGLNVEYKYEDLEEMVIDIFVNLYSAKTLKGILEFAKTETGKKFYETQDYIIQETQKRLVYILKVEGKTIDEHIRDQ